MRGGFVTGVTPPLWPFFFNIQKQQLARSSSSWLPSALLVLRPLPPPPPPPPQNVTILSITRAVFTVPCACVCVCDSTTATSQLRLNEPLVVVGAFGKGTAQQQQQWLFDGGHNTAALMQQ